MMRLRLAFMGTPDFALPTLAALIEAGHDIAAVYCQPPRKSGRGHQVTKSPVHRFADTRGMPVRTPVSLKQEEDQQLFAALNLDAAIVVAYGLILPPAILTAPRLGCINVHASLLPRWRGAAPIQRAILAGDDETGVTIMAMDEGLDTGPTISRKATPIADDATAGDLHDTLAALGARLIVPALDALATGQITPRAQPDTGATYAAKITKQDGVIDWRDADTVLRQVRALNPWPGVTFQANGQAIKVLAAERVEGPAGAPAGTVLDGRLAVACGSGAVRLTKLQRPGKAPLDVDAFLRGFPLPEGTRL
ncbi:MAG: methionyl-tRNA formyltransferase [Pseudomonadota bacterium]